MAKVIKRVALSAISIIYLSLSASPVFANPAAEAYEAKGEYELAVFQYKLDELSEKDNPKLFNKIGSLLYRLGKYNESSSYFRKAISLDNTVSNYHYNIAMAYTKLSRDNDAYKAFKQAIAINPNQEKYHHKLGNLLYIHKKYQDAIKEYNTILKINNKYPQAYYNLGLTYNNLQKYQESASYLKKFLKLKPNDPDGMEMLGKVTAKLNDNSDDLVDSPSNNNNSSDPFSTMPNLNSGTGNNSNDPFSTMPTNNDKSDEIGFEAFSNKTNGSVNKDNKDSVD